MDRSTIDLDARTIESPCTVPWDSMSGNERKRFCAQCRLHVHDVSQMTRSEALELLAATGGDCCLRLWRRPDGRVVTKDCGRVRLAIERRLLWIRAAAATVLAVLGLSGCRSQRLTDRAPGATTPTESASPRADGAVPTTGK